MNTFSKKQAFLFGWQKFKENLSFLLILFFTVGVVSLLFDLINQGEYATGAIVIAVGMIAFIIQIVIEMGLTKVVLNIHDGLKVGFKTMTEPTHVFLYYTIATILSLFVIIAGLIFFIIPGLIFAIGLMFVPYLVIDKELGPIAAMKKSWSMTKGHRWNLLWFNVLVLGLNILGLLALGVGLLVTVPVSFIAVAYAYRFIDAAPVPAPEVEANA